MTYLEPCVGGGRLTPGLTSPRQSATHVHVLVVQVIDEVGGGWENRRSV